MYFQHEKELKLLKGFINLKKNIKSACLKDDNGLKN